MISFNNSTPKTRRLIEANSGSCHVSVKQSMSLSSGRSRSLLRQYSIDFHRRQRPHVETPTCQLATSSGERMTTALDWDNVRRPTYWRRRTGAGTGSNSDVGRRPTETVARLPSITGIPPCLPDSRLMTSHVVLPGPCAESALRPGSRGGGSPKLK